MVKTKEILEYCQMSARAFKYKNNCNAENEEQSWYNILMEEVYESFAETDPGRQQEEMIQVAAVAVQIIEYLNRKMEEGK
jgi:hypothetical protein